MQIRVVLVLLSLLCQSLGTEARPLRDNKIPPSLAPWVPWVLYAERDRECPFIHNQLPARRCAWPSRLVLKIDKNEGEFIQFWRVYRESERKARVRANSFAEVSAVEWFDVASPICRQPPLFDMPMEARIRPKAYLCHVPVLHRVPMDVIDMPVEVGLIADEMFPKSMLP